MTSNGVTAASITPAEIAEILITGERERKEVPQISDTYGDVDIAKAYQAQKVFVQSKLDAGERLVGFKLGLTSRNKQRAMGVDSPLYGRVTSSMLSTYGEPIPFDRFIHPQGRVRDRLPDRQGPAGAGHRDLRAGRDRVGLRRSRRARFPV